MNEFLPASENTFIGADIAQAVTQQQTAQTVAVDNKLAQLDQWGTLITAGAGAGIGVADQLLDLFLSLHARVVQLEQLFPHRIAAAPALPVALAVKVAGSK